MTPAELRENEKAREKVLGPRDAGRRGEIGGGGVIIRACVPRPEALQRDKRSLLDEKFPDNDDSTQGIP